MTSVFWYVGPNMKMEKKCYVEALVTIYRSTQCYTEYFVIYSLYETGNSPKFDAGIPTTRGPREKWRYQVSFRPEQAVTRPRPEPSTAQTQSWEHYYYISLPNTK